jgi:phosphoglycerate dehydrogenase-like enzyme
VAVSDAVFRVGLTRDMRSADGGSALGDLGLDMLEQVDGLEWDFLARDAAELAPELVEGYDALLVFGPAVTRATLQGVERLRLVARLGVGYDTIDVDALTERGILLTITPDAVRRPVGAGAMALLLALSHQLVLKDRLTRSGRWDEGAHLVGVGLRGRTLGVIGLGNIGTELLELARPFGMRHLAADPHLSGAEASARGAELVELDELMVASDFVCVTCPLTESTHRLVDAHRLDLMRPTAFLINVARGPIVDQEALTAALVERRIAGAGLDVFEREPIDLADPLLALDNVIVTPHSIGGTDEAFLRQGQSACAAVLDVAAGRAPEHMVNPDALEVAARA